jgi:hypothetical protein
MRRLGFAQGKIHGSRAHIPMQRRGRKPFPTTLKTFGDWLRAKRLILDLRQPQLATKLGISSCRLGLLERNQTPPTDADA